VTLRKIDCPLVKHLNPTVAALGCKAIVRSTNPLRR
jgi:hypothetical protein